MSVISTATQVSGCTIVCGDNLEVMKGLDDQSVDLVVCSPPYEDSRLYGELKFKVKGQDWVDWCIPRFLECLRVTRGLVAWVVAGKTRKFRYSCVPQLLMADLHRRGIHLRNPPIFHRVGIPGSGGPDWLRSDYETIICATNGGKLPWSDNTACGHPPKWAPGGAMSHRVSNGARVNQWGHSIASGGTVTLEDGDHTSGDQRPSRREASKKRTFADKAANGAKVHSKMDPDGMRDQAYLPPALANPGNVFRFVVGGGLLGHKLAHGNEAPFPLGLAEVFVRSFCPPGGVVLDPFIGSGTTAHAAIRNGRKCIGIDQRQSQVDLTLRRIADVTRPLAEA